MQVPTGCGEQNMIGFVPNILVRRYLEETKLLTDSLRDRTTANMQTGQSPQLSAVTPRISGSDWLKPRVPHRPPSRRPSPGR